MQVVAYKSTDGKLWLSELSCSNHDTFLRFRSNVRACMSKETRSKLAMDVYDTGYNMAIDSVEEFAGALALSSESLSKIIFKYVEHLRNNK